MEMKSVISSNIHSIGYEKETLYIRFNSGALYSYSNVPKSIYIALMNASSHGEYFAAFIKDVYNYRRIS